MTSIPAGPTRFSYQPALDGIRGAAVIVIMLYHGDVSWMGGGFVTVDSFFVLSGFLITSLLLIEYRNKSRIALREFWARRARRLLPALFLMLAAVLLYGSLVSSDISAERLRGDTLSTLGYVSNWRFILTGASYFDQFAIASPLRHTWTLAIEEQWYVLWPLILPVLLMVTRARLSRLLLVLGAIATASAAFMAWIYVPGTDPSRVYYGTDTRLQALLVGAAVAVILVWRPGPSTSGGRRLLQGAGVAAAAFCVWAAFSMGETSLFYFRGGLALFAVSIAVVIAATVQPESTPLKRMLSWDRIRWVGLLSYGLYLWHWPVYVFVDADTLGSDGFPLLAVRFALSFSLAIMSYYLVELPIRRGEFFRRRTWALAGAGLALVAALVLVTTSTDLLPSRSGTSVAAEAAERFGREAGAEHNDQQLERGDDSDVTTALMVGDSTAVTLGYSYTSEVDPGLVVPTEAVLGCGVTRGELFSEGASRPVDEECARWPTWWTRGVDVHQPDVSVVLVGPWEVFDRRIDGERVEFGTPEFAEYLRGEFDEGFDILERSGQPIVILTTPYMEQSDADPLGWGAERNEQWRIDWLNDLYRTIAEEPRSVPVHVIDFGAYVDETIAEEGGDPFRYDGLHFSEEGAARAWEWLAPQLQEIAATVPRTGETAADAGAPVR